MLDNLNKGQKHVKFQLLIKVEPAPPKSLIFSRVIPRYKTKLTL